MPYIKDKDGNEVFVDSLASVERYHLEHVLEVTDWNKSLTAAGLEVDRRTVYRMIKKHGLKPNTNI